MLRRLEGVPVVRLWSVLLAVLLGALITLAPAHPLSGSDGVRVAVKPWYSNEPIYDARGRVWSDSAGSIPTDGTYCFAYGLGSKLMSAAGLATVEATTGFPTPSPSAQYQRSTDDNWYGSNTCQIAGRGMGFQLHKDSIVAHNSLPAPGDLYGMQMVRNWGTSREVQPWAAEFGESARLNISATYGLQSKATNETIQYGQFVISLVDTTESDPAFSDSIWLTIEIMDTRRKLAESVHPDSGGTKNYVVTTFAGHGLAFVTPELGSQTVDGGGCECSSFSMSVTRQNLIAAVKAVNDKIGRPIYSSDPSSYAVNLVGVGTEMFSPQGTTGWIGSHVNDLSLKTEYITSANRP